MMTKSLDTPLKHNVEDELEWDPVIDASKIGVAAVDGVITLTGTVHGYSEKWSAEKIAKRVLGVRAVANDIEVVLENTEHRDDSDIALSAVNALNWNFSIPKDRIEVTVTKGWLTLDGEVDWQYQRRAAEDAVRHLRGVRGLSNQIVVRPKVQSVDVKDKIESALKRNAELDAKHIVVQTTEGSVTLTGAVRSWVEREDAVNAAWSAPGVTKVVDRIEIRP
ncbi:MAG TPA: BON domain-containing protein [Thermoanaerobaculia bacterium]|nr:BON domain-containing protein [Thermoanaerobaculia bacterium]